MLKKSLLGTFVLLLVLAGTGTVYQSVRSAQDLSRFPAPGEYYEIDGLTMHMDCRGTGSPTVLFESGLTTASLSWSLVHDEIARETRVCAYDRPGLDWSEPIGRTVYAPEISERLHKLLQVAQITDDIILVGMSAGGVYVREFYKHYPSKIVGMVFVDSSHEQQANRLPEGDGGSTAEMVLGACRFVQPLGLMRILGLIDNFIESFIPTDIMGEDSLNAIKASLNRSHSCSAIYWEMRSFYPQEVSDENPPEKLGDLPLFVLSQGKEPEAVPEMGFSLEDAVAQLKVWNVLQEELTALSTRGQRFVAGDSGHGIQFEQPQIVIDKIILLVNTIRKN